ncbi:MAG: type II secretory pathway component PulK [Bradymonadia bacterium]
MLVLTTIAVLAMILVEFSSSAHTHLSMGVNVRDEVRATHLAETALVMTRACLDQSAWGPLGGQQDRIDPEKLCDMMLGIFVRSRVDLPIGGLSVELKNVQGLGLEKGDVEEITLKAEDSFIGLAGLRCEPGQRACSTRLRVMSQLRSLLCDPRIAQVFDLEQEDGKKYTREEVVGNLIDWVDADNNRIYIDPLNWGVLQDGTGEGEDAYLRELEERYRSKDAPFESIQELRLVRGVNDELYEYLKDRVSVYAASARVNVNSAQPDVIGAMLGATIKGYVTMAFEGCGEDVETLGPGFGNIRDALNAYAVIVRDATIAKQGFFISKPYRNEGQFLTIARDPARYVYDKLVQATGGLGGQVPDYNTFLMQRYRMPIELYTAIQGEIDFKQVQKSITVQNRVFRLRVRGKVGNMTKQIFAILRAEGKTVRTLYYREE